MSARYTGPERRAPEEPYPSPAHEAAYLAYLAETDHEPGDVPDRRQHLPDHDTRDEDARQVDRRQPEERGLLYTEEDPAPDMTRNHLVWSYEHRAWWNPNSWGYTTELPEAGWYTKAEAERICRQANRHGELNEQAVPVLVPVPYDIAVEHLTRVERCGRIATLRAAITLLKAQSQLDGVHLTTTSHAEQELAEEEARLAAYDAAHQ